MIKNRLMEHRWDDMDSVMENVSVSPKHPWYCSCFQQELCMFGVARGLQATDR